MIVRSDYIFGLVCAMAITFPLSFAKFVVGNSNSKNVLQTRQLSTADESGSINNSSRLATELTIQYDPPDRSSWPAALGVFARAYYDGEPDTSAKIYYEQYYVFQQDQTATLQGGEASVTFNSSYAEYDKPYIQLGTPFKAQRIRYLKMVAVRDDPLDDKSFIRSEEITLTYYVEGAARKNSFGFLVPGIESGGYFLRFALEVEGKARAQAAGSQEFADFFTALGIGTYDTQVQALDLLTLANVTGFEGGFAGKHEQPCFSIT